MVDGVERAIERRAGHDARVILRLEGCTDRDGAEAIAWPGAVRGSRSRARARARTSGGPRTSRVWPWCDGERKVGTVARLLALPSCEVLEVERAEGGEPLLVPLVSDAVRTVDLEHQQVDVDLGFLGEE